MPRIEYLIGGITELVRYKGKIDRKKYIFFQQYLFFLYICILRKYLCTSGLLKYLSLIYARFILYNSSNILQIFPFPFLSMLKSPENL